jgi:calcineurin-like phosphoesterase family protein
MEAHRSRRLPGAGARRSKGWTNELTIQTWFTADTHFGHANIIRYCDRPFASVEAMRAGLVERWNAVVAPGDRVLVLGDFALGRIDETLAVLPELNGVKDLLVGNHDRPFDPDPRQRSIWTARYLEAGFRSVVHGTVGYRLGGVHPVLLGHLPYTGDSHGEDRYAQLRPADTGLPIVHGHVHTSWHRSGRQLNVGVDVNDYTPVSEEAVVATLTEAGVLAGAVAEGPS